MSFFCQATMNSMFLAGKIQWLHVRCIWMGVGVYWVRNRKWNNMAGTYFWPPSTIKLEGCQFSNNSTTVWREFTSFCTWTNVFSPNVNCKLPLRNIRVGKLNKNLKESSDNIHVLHTCNLRMASHFQLISMQAQEIHSFRGCAGLLSSSTHDNATFLPGLFLSSVKWKTWRFIP